MPLRAKKNEKIVHVRHRRARPGPESELLDAITRSGFLVGSKLSAVLFHEPDMPTGLPDLVAVYLSAEKAEANRYRARLEEKHVRLLHYLHLVKRVSPETILDQLRMRRSELTSSIRELTKSGLITADDKWIRPVPLGRVFRVRHIIAIEAKVRDWTRALAQASANRWFASHSYILIPSTAAIEKIKDRAKDFGVGVLVFDGERVRVALRPLKHRIPSSYGSWLFNEWAIRRLNRR